MHELGFQQSSLSDFVLTFAKMMVGGDFQTASGMLSDAMRDEYPPSQLKAAFESMYAYAGDTVIEHVEVANTIEDWPEKESAILGRVLVLLNGPDRIHGGSWSEMFDAGVSEIEGRWQIYDIVWGRP